MRGNYVTLFIGLALLGLIGMSIYITKDADYLWAVLLLMFVPTYSTTKTGENNEE